MCHIAYRLLIMQSCLENPDFDVGVEVNRIKRYM